MTIKKQKISEGKRKDGFPELESLANFAVDTRWEDLPGAVVHEMKRLLLDTIGCALTGTAVDQGKMIVALARRLGGPPEASILGLGDKVSLFSAVLANGQLINATDFDGFVADGHGPPYLIPGPLAIAEAKGSSGKDLILAIAIACEIAGRVDRAVKQDLSYLRERHGYAVMNFGAAVGGGKLLKFNHEQMKDALGMAGHTCQILTYSHHLLTKRGHYFKYGIPGWQNTGAMMAVLLAEMGYAGDRDIFNADHGFWKCAGFGGWAPEKITEKHGKAEAFSTVGPGQIMYKPHICCKVFASAIDAFYDITEKNNLSPDEIENIKVYSPQGLWADHIVTFKNKKIENVIDAQFSIPFNVSLAAYRVPIGVEWQDPDIRKDPKILQFMKKISVTAGYPGWEKVGSVLSRRTRIEVKARGKTFIEDRAEAKGSGNLHVTDEQLEKKFRHNASRLLTGRKIERAVEALWNLEKVKHISELMNQLSL